MTRAKFGDVPAGALALFTDLYELTMMQGYLESGHQPTATFSLFFRTLPANRGYVVAAGFGPGTALVTSEDAPTLDAVYKLVEVERAGELRPSMKPSPGKVTYPGRKSVRRVERDGRFERDVLALRDEDVEGDEQLVDVFVDGSLAYSLPTLDERRDRTRGQLERLPPGTRALRDPAAYPVRVSDGLRSLTETVRDDLSSRAPGDR